MMELAITDLISVAGALGGSALLGLVKHHTRALDGKIGDVVKPFQPVIVMAAGIGLPFLTDALGIAPVDPQVFVTAPSATIALVSMREGTRRLRGLKRSQGAS